MVLTFWRVERRLARSREVQRMKQERETDGGGVGMVGESVSACEKQRQEVAEDSWSQSASESMAFLWLEGMVRKHTHQ